MLGSKVSRKGMYMFDGKVKEFAGRLVTELESTADLMDANANSSMIARFGPPTPAQERLTTVAVTLRTLAKILIKVSA